MVESHVESYASDGLFEQVDMYGLGLRVSLASDDEVEPRRADTISTHSKWRFIVPNYAHKV